MMSYILVERGERNQREVETFLNEVLPHLARRRAGGSTMAEAQSDIVAKAYEAVELAKKTGKIKKGTNEATKAIERGVAKLVLVAKDMNPPEITMHLGPLCKEKNAPLVEVPSKEELGAAAGLSVPTGVVAIVVEGEARDIIKELGVKETAKGKA